MGQVYRGSIFPTRATCGVSGEAAGIHGCQSQAVRKYLPEEITDTMIRYVTSTEHAVTDLLGHEHCTHGHSALFLPSLLLDSGYLLAPCWLDCGID